MVLRTFFIMIFSLLTISLFASGLEVGIKGELTNTDNLDDFDAEKLDLGNPRLHSFIAAATGVGVGDGVGVDAVDEFVYETRDENEFGDAPAKRVKRDVSSFLRNLFRGYSNDEEKAKYVESTMPPERKCRTKECGELSTFLRGNMNPQADPCDDFWEYSCGGWQNSTIPNTKLSWGPVHAMNDQISAMQKRWLEKKNGVGSKGDVVKGLEATTRRWYRTCMNETAMEGNVEVLKKIISNVGGWHAAGSLNSNWTVLQGISFLQDLNVLIPFYDAKIVKDDKNVSRNLIKLYQPTVMFAKTPYYYNESSPDYKRNIITGYLTTISSLGQLLGLTPTVAKRFAQTTFNFERKLARILVPFDSELKLDAKNTYNIVKMGNLSSVCPYVDLQGIFRQLSEEYFANDDQDLLVFNEAFFLRLSQLLRDSSTEELSNYIVWTVASSAERFLPQRFRDGLNNFRLVRYGHKEEHRRWLQCAKSAPFPFVIGNDFVSEFFSESSRGAAQILIDDIRHEFIIGINKTDCLDQQTKDMAIEKMESMVTRIGYPNFIKDEKKLAEFYSNYSFDEKANLLQQRLDYLEHAKGRVIETLWVTNNRSEWYTNPMLVNAFYHRIDNSITFPAGILQPPLFKKDYPDFHNFGSMGYIMGHEMVHAFDYNGAKYDSEGNLREWMTQISKRKYEEKTRCISDFYSKFKINGRNINGNITLGENIADIAGLKYAFRAYETQASKRHPNGESTLPGLHVSPQKTFFLSFASFHCKKWRASLDDTLLSRSHAPSPIRVNGAVSQSQEFAQVFNCPVGSRMNPETKCNIF